MIENPWLEHLRRTGAVLYRHAARLTDEAAAVASEPVHLDELCSLFNFAARDLWLDLTAGVPQSLDALRRSGADAGGRCALAREGSAGSSDPRSRMWSGGARGERVVALPARVHDAAQALAVYPVRPEAAQTLLARSQLEAGPVRGGPRLRAVRYADCALATLMFVEYRHTDLGSYHELALAIDSEPVDERGVVLGPPGLFFIAMLVDQPFTHEAGRAVWGYPKQLAVMRLRRLDRTSAADRADAALLEVSVLDGSSTLLQVCLPTGGRSLGTDVLLQTYTMLEGQLCRVPIRRSARGQGYRLGEPIALRIVQPSHPLCAAIRALDLGERAMRYVWSEHMSAELLQPLPV